MFLGEHRGKGAQERGVSLRKSVPIDLDALLGGNEEEKENE